MPETTRLSIHDDPFVRFKDQEPITGLGRTTAYDYIKRGLMPAPVKLGPRACGWRLSTLSEWLASRPKAEGEVAYARRRLMDSAAQADPNQEAS